MTNREILATFPDEKLKELSECYHAIHFWRSQDKQHGMSHEGRTAARLVEKGVRLLTEAGLSSTPDIGGELETAANLWRLREGSKS